MLGVLDVGAQADEAVDVAGQLRGDDGLRPVAGFGDLGSGAGGIQPHHRLEVELADQAAALVERVDMTVHVRELLDPRARQRQQVVVHPLIVLADDVQAGARQQVVDVGDAAGDRVLDRDHRQPGLAVADGRERVLERPAGQRRQLRPRRAAGEIGVGAERALKGDDAIRVGRGRRPRRRGGHRAGSAGMARTRSRSARVSTPSGTVSTTATSMRMPFSSARSCSRRSRPSSTPGGSATNRASAFRR